MFNGEYIQKMDTKGRTVVPAKFREELGTGIVVSRGLDNCLYAYSKEAWNTLQEKMDTLSFADKKVRRFSRFFLAGAMDLETDKLGRVLISSVLRSYASLDKEVVWAGVGNRIEIWDIDKWNAEMSSYLEGDDAEETIDELAAYMAEKGI